MSEKERKPNKVYDRLKKAILYMEIKPGQAIGEVEIANQFGVSRTPVRDAFKKLEADGLLEIRSHIGTYVSFIDLEQIVDTIFMRENIEKAIIKSLAENPLGAHNIRIAYVLNAQQELLDSEISGQQLASKFMELDNEFHRLMFELAGRERVWGYLQQHRHHYDRFRIFINNDDREKLTEVLKQHQNIAAFIKEKNTAGAIELFEKHVYYNLMNSTEKIMANKQYFKGFGDLQLR